MVLCYGIVRYGSTRSFSNFRSLGESIDQLLSAWLEQGCQIWSYSTIARRRHSNATLENWGTWSDYWLLIVTEILFHHTKTLLFTISYTFDEEYGGDRKVCNSVYVCVCKCARIEKGEEGERWERPRRRRRRLTKKKKKKKKNENLFFFFVFSCLCQRPPIIIPH